MGFIGSIPVGQGSIGGTLVGEGSIGSILVGGSIGSILLGNQGPTGSIIVGQDSIFVGQQRH